MHTDEDETQMHQLLHQSLSNRPLSLSQVQAPEPVSGSHAPWQSTKAGSTRACILSLAKPSSNFMTICMRWLHVCTLHSHAPKPCHTDSISDGYVYMGAGARCGTSSQECVELSPRRLESNAVKTKCQSGQASSNGSHRSLPRSSQVAIVRRSMLLCVPSQSPTYHKHKVGAHFNQQHTTAGPQSTTSHAHASTSSLEVK
jgi:hypothetical protein